MWSQIAALTPTSAIAFGGGIARTTDAGASWDRLATWQPALTPAVDSVDHAVMVSSSEAWLLGTVLLHTTDSGATWQKNGLALPHAASGLDFRDPMHGWIVGANGMTLRSTDGGASWDEHDLSTSDTVSGVSFIDDLHGWCIAGNASKGALYHTTDGGVSWAPFAGVR